MKLVFSQQPGRWYNGINTGEVFQNVPTRLDKLTLDFILAVILTDCQILFFIWYEVFYKTGDSTPATLLGLGIGVSISLAVTIVIFAHWETVRMISERYKRMRFNAGFEAGKEAGQEEGREVGQEAERNRIKELLEQGGVELTPEFKERLFGKPEEKRS